MSVTPKLRIQGHGKCGDGWHKAIYRGDLIMIYCLKTRETIANHNRCAWIRPDGFRCKGPADFGGSDLCVFHKRPKKTAPPWRRR